MSRNLRKVFASMGVVALAVLALSQLPGCGGGGNGGGSTTGTLQVGLTDKQSDLFANVFVTIKEVRVVPAGLEDAADNDSRLPVVVSYSTPRTVDVLTLRFQQEILGTIPLPAGSYNQVRLILAPNPSGQAAPANYVVLKSDQSIIPLKTPSGQQSGLKVLGKFEVKAGILNAILLDFDPNTAIVIRGNGDYNLKPTGIRIIQPASPLPATFGSLSGTVASTGNWSSATVLVVPRGGSNPIAAGTIFSNFSSSRWEGEFTAFAPPGEYRVHLQANGFAPYSSPFHRVTESQDTSLGEILLTP